MAEARMFLAPDYAPDFHCKCGACRHTCCTGWEVTVTLADYFRLLSVPCSPALRRRLDTALHLVENPSEERYACILPDWQGRCPMQRADGLCALECECGAEALSLTCRMFPRGVRTADGDEYSCSGACEAVLEALFAREAPLAFHPVPLTVEAPLPPPLVTGEAARESRAIRQLCRLMLQRRAWSLPQRILGLERLLTAIAAAPTARLAAARHAFELPEAPFPAEVPPLAALEYRRRIALRLMDGSASLREYLPETLAALGLTADAPAGEEALAASRAALARFAGRFPAWEVYAEHMLVNHVFYRGFPYTEHPAAPAEGALSLAAVYAMLRLLAVGWTAEHPRQEDLVDVCAAALRLMEHSSFDWNALVLLEQSGLPRQEALARLLQGL